MNKTAKTRKPAARKKEKPGGRLLPGFFLFCCFYSAFRKGLEVEVHCQVGTEVLRAELECAR